MIFCGLPALFEEVELTVLYERFAQANTLWSRLRKGLTKAKHRGYPASERPSPIEALAAHGYTTAGFSTNPHLSRATGYDRGFHYFYELEPAETDPWLRHIKGGQFLLRTPWTHCLLQVVGQRMRPARIYASAAEVTDKLCQWLDDVEPPFFAWAHYMDAHWPYHPEEELTHPASIARAW